VPVRDQQCHDTSCKLNMFVFQRDFKERIQQQKSTQNRLKEQRQQMARAKKYHSDYHVQHRARLMRARTKEEKVGGGGRSQLGPAATNHYFRVEYVTCCL